MLLAIETLAQLHAHVKIKRYLSQDSIEMRVMPLAAVFRELLFGLCRGDQGAPVARTRHGCFNECFNCRYLHAKQITFMKKYACSALCGGRLRPLRSCHFPGINRAPRE